MQDVHVIYVNYHPSHEPLLGSLRSLAASHAGSALTRVTTVVDNWPDASLGDPVNKEFPDVEYIHTGKNLGLGKGANIGIRRVPARYYLVLNMDTAFDRTPLLLDRLVAYMDAHPEVGMCGPKLLNSDGSLQDTCFRFDLRSLLTKPLRQIGLDRYPRIGAMRDRLLMRDVGRDANMPVDWVLGAVLLARHDAAWQAGFFDPRYFLYMEDCDWCRSMWERGWQVHFVHDVEMTHAYGRATAHVGNPLFALLRSRPARAHLANWLRYLWKWRGRHRNFGL